MNRYNCLVVDDNKIERDLLRMHLEKIPQIQIAAVCKDGLEAQQALNTHDIDIVFSDIDMPELSGISLLKSIKKSPVFIFISSHPEYAVESYNLDVIDFIVKPASFERVLKSANKAIEYLDLKKNIPGSQASVGGSMEHYFFIRESNDLVKLLFNDVAYIESMGDFSKIYTTDGKRHITLVSLKNLEMQLSPEYFTRIHKQYIVNHQHITAISNEEIAIAGNLKLPFSHTFKQALLDKVVNKKIVTRHFSKD